MRKPGKQTAARYERLDSKPRECRETESEGSQCAGDWRAGSRRAKGPRAEGGSGVARRATNCTADARTAGIRRHAEGSKAAFTLVFASNRTRRCKEPQRRASFRTRYGSLHARASELPQKPASLSARSATIRASCRDGTPITTENRALHCIGIGTATRSERNEKHGPGGRVLSHSNPGFIPWLQEAASQLGVRAYRASHGIKPRSQKGGGREQGPRDKPPQPERQAARPDSTPPFTVPRWFSV